MPINALSSLGRKILQINPLQAYRSLLPKSTGDPQAATLLDSASPEALLLKPTSTDDAQLVKAALYLWHDYLDQSHQISQNITSATGSFWHAIMHRRQGDFSNSKYWYARCAAHPVLAILAAQANPVLNPLPLDKSILKLTLNGWQPNAFVDLVEMIAGRDDDPRHAIAVSLQQLEWQILFDHTTRAAGASAEVELFSPER